MWARVAELVDRDTPVLGEEPEHAPVHVVEGVACGRSSRHGRQPPCGATQRRRTARTPEERLDHRAETCTYCRLAGNGRSMDRTSVRAGSAPGNPNPSGSTSRSTIPAAPTRSTWPGGPRSPRSRPPTCRGQPIPTVAYVPEEHALWALVARELARQAREVRLRRVPAGNRPPRAADRPGPAARAGRPAGCTGSPASGSSRCRAWCRPARSTARSAERRFLSTQYIRHHSVPFYTPEPDIVHELVGHANMLASPMFADLYQAAGAGVAAGDQRRGARVLQPGVLVHARVRRPVGGGELRTYGAGPALVVR